MGIQPETLPPADSSIHAAVRLLSDDDPNVARACRRQLLEWGPASRAALGAASDSPDARLRVRARSLLRALDLRVQAERLCQLGQRAVVHGDSQDLLSEGLLCIAAFHLGEQLDAERVRATIRTLADQLRPTVIGRSSLTAARNLAGHLAGRNGFTGGEPRPYSRDHLLLDRVVECRRGAPVTLVALYLLVGRLAGLHLTAVRLPDFYLVRVHGRRNILIDPFHAGRMVTRADCLRYVRERGAVASATQLADVADVDLLIGVLDDLAGARDLAEGGELRSAIRRVRRFLAGL